jgi:hypothetical protein
VPVLDGTDDFTLNRGVRRIWHSATWGAGQHWESRATEMVSLVV